MTRIEIDHPAMIAALKRLLDLARSDTGQSARVARFLMAWWNGPDLGDFPIADLFGLDRNVAGDMLAANVRETLARKPFIATSAAKSKKD